MPLHRGTLALILQAGIPAITTFLSVLVLTGTLLTSDFSSSESNESLMIRA